MLRHFCGPIGTGLWCALAITACAEDAALLSITDAADSTTAAPAVLDMEAVDLDALVSEASCVSADLVDVCDCPVHAGIRDRRTGGGLLLDNGIQIHSFLSHGITWNTDNPPNNSNIPVTFNDRANEYQMNQLYLAVERPVATCGACWDVGGRFDLLYGTDYFFTTATGLETHADGSQHWNSGSGPRGAGPGAAGMYGLALPQMYAELYAPFAGGVNMKLGHFYSPLGYEQVMATENFFYSHSYAKQYGEPFTHTGALAESNYGENLQFVIGGTMGWNSFDSSRNQWGIVGGTKWFSADESSSLALMFHTGDDGPPGVNNPSFFNGPVNPNNVSVYSLVLSHWLSDRTQYVLQHDFGVEQDGAFSGGSQNAAKWYGVNQYLLHDVNDCWSLGLRFEWFRDQDHSRVLDLAAPGIPVSGGNYYALTAGANWSPCQDVFFRPEIRWDWSDTESPALGVGGPYDVFTKDDQLTVALDMIVLF